MYESFYGLKEKPFTLLPDPEYLYLSPKHQRALTLLEYGMMNQAGFSVICGDTGAGKTTLIRRLLSELDENTTVGLITNTHRSFGELLNWVLMAFGLDGEGKSKAHMHQVFIDFLIDQYGQNKHTVLIVDEAQNMQADTLEELRMLSNINADKDQVLQVILAGQPALRETLRRPELMQFAQRIAVDYYLEALSMEETSAYIHHRLMIAGAESKIFTDAACNAIHKYSGGTPRLINLLCDTSLVYGFAEQSATINEQLVHDVVHEQHSNSIIPTFNTNQPHATDNMPPPTPLHDASAVETTQSTSPDYQPAQPNRSSSEASASRKAAIADLAQRAVAAVKQADKVQQPQVPTDEVVVPTQPANKAASVSSASSQPPTESTASSYTDEPVPAPDAIEEAKESSHATADTMRETRGPTNPVNNEIVEKVSEAAAEYTTEVQSEAASTSPHEGMYAARRVPNEAGGTDLYPIVHVEENPGKGVNMMILGLAGGMFVASLVMVVFVWFMFGRDDSPMQQQTVAPDAQYQQRLEDVNRREMEALKKERDAALAVTRALERERDAALSAAKAQEETRIAELKAAELLAEQERKTETSLREAREKARRAEQAESQARAKERRLRQQAEQRAAELEKQRLETLRLEQARQKALQEARQAELKRQEEIEQQLKRAAEQKESRMRAAPVKKSNNPPVQQEEKTSKKFSANPCNSASAKFLSTCKK